MMMKLALVATAAILLLTRYAEGNTQITVDHTQTFQSFYGCGASWTDSAAWIMNGVRNNPSTDPRALSTQEKDEIFSALFSKSSDDGIGLDIVRQPMGTSDFRWSDYTYEDNRGSFSIDRDKSYIIPTILRSFQENPNLKVMAVPWSAPAWAKNNNNLNGGGIVTNDQGTLHDYHQYFVNYVNAYEAEGVPIWAVSVQNEPQHSSSDYPTMTMSAADHGKLIQGVRSALDAANYADIKVVGYDHNWDTPNYVSEALNSDNGAGRDAVSAIAFHCYGGDVSAQSSIHAQFPQVEIFFTECTEHGDLHSFNGDFRWALRTLVIGATRNWASTVIEWNMVLFNNGPKINGGCENCRGLIDVLDSGYQKNPAFYALGHLSKFLQVGAQRIGSSEPTSNTKTLAMLNPDGSSFVIVLNDGSPDLTYDLVWMGATCTVEVKSWSAVTVVRSPGSYTMQVWRTTDQQSQTRLVHTEDIACVSSGPTPTLSPTVQPTPSTVQPTLSPTVQPTPSTVQPTLSPTVQPTPSPTVQPTPSPTVQPTPSTVQPTVSPTVQPTVQPTLSPTLPPTSSIVQPTLSPTVQPTVQLTLSPTVQPAPSTVQPILSPTVQPTPSPTVQPTLSPTVQPTTTGGSSCCTYDFRICITGSCGDSEANCQGCNGYWGVVDGICLPFWTVCTNEVNPNCCGGATCQGNQWHKACVPP